MATPAPAAVTVTEPFDLLFDTEKRRLRGDGARMAERVQYPDAGGDPLTLVKFPNSVLLDTFFEKVDFDAISSFPLRDDDIIMCSYPRCGVHWFWEQARMILVGRHDLDDILEKDAGMLEFHFRGEIDTLESPRLLNSHFLYEQLPKDMMKKKTKVIFMYRNPKDVAVSYYHFHSMFYVYEYNGKFGNWLQLFQEGKVDWGSYHDYLKDWERVIGEHPEMPVHLINYEDLKQNPVEELGRLCQFLDVSRDEEFLQQVSQACTINRLRSRKKAYWQSGNYENKAAQIIYRQGQAGSWKNLFTVAQSEQFDRYWAEAMAGSKLFMFK